MTKLTLGRRDFLTCSLAASALALSGFGAHGATLTGGIFHGLLPGINTTPKVPTLLTPDYSLDAKWLEEQTPLYRKLHWTKSQWQELDRVQRLYLDPRVTWGGRSTASTSRCR